MDSNLRSRLTRLFEETNGHSIHPMDEWLEWIKEKHPELVNQMIDEIMTRTDMTNEDLPAAYMAAGAASIFCGSQLFFDVVSGTIFGKDHEPFPTGEVLHNADQVRQRAHELVDQIFDQYTKEFQEKREEENDGGDSDEGEDEFDPNDPPLDDPDNPLIEDEIDDVCNEEHSEFEWEEVKDEDSDPEMEEG